MTAPKLLVTGFGPFPNAPENPTADLVRTLAAVPAGALGASAFRAVVLATDYRKSWTALRRIYSAFAPDVVVHFGLSRKAEAITVERIGRRRIHRDKPDAAGFAPRSGLARRSGPDTLVSNLDVPGLLHALQAAGFSAEASDNAGGYVCDATLYRSLHAAMDTERLVGFVHVPPVGRSGLTQKTLQEAATLILTAATSAWRAKRAETLACE